MILKINRPEVVHPAANTLNAPNGTLCEIVTLGNSVPSNWVVGDVVDRMEGGYWFNIRLGTYVNGGGWNGTLKQINPGETVSIIAEAPAAVKAAA